MKIRTGFVSNSSSSSFVIMMSKKAGNATLEQMDKAVKIVVDLMYENNKFMGSECLVRGTLTTRSDEDYWESFFEYDLDKENFKKDVCEAGTDISDFNSYGIRDFIWDQIDKYEKKVKELFPEDVLIHTMDM